MPIHYRKYRWSIWHKTYARINLLNVIKHNLDHFKVRSSISCPPFFTEVFHELFLQQIWEFPCVNLDNANYDNAMWYTSKTHLSNWLLGDFPQCISLLPHTIVPNNYLCLSIEYIYHHITQGYLTLTVCVFVRQEVNIVISVRAVHAWFILSAFWLVCFV